MNAVNESLALYGHNGDKALSSHNCALLHKQKVAKGFDSAAIHYNEQAKIQHEIADYGLTRLEKMSKGMALSLLDIGCGTALSYERLRRIAKHVNGLDISLNMLRQALVNRHFDHSPCFTGINGDAENLPFKSSSVDTIFSSMALQWCQSPEQALSEVHRVLKPNGKALLCILSGESFESLQNAWLHLGLPSRINTFHSTRAWTKASEDLNWSLNMHTRSFTSYHRNVIDMLLSIKNIGANTKISIANNELNHYMGKAEVKALSAHLKKDQMGSEFLPLSYHLVFLELNK